MGLTLHCPSLGASAVEGLAQAHCSRSSRLAGRRRPRTTVWHPFARALPLARPAPPGQGPHHCCSRCLARSCSEWPRCQSPGGSRGAWQGGGRGGAPSPPTTTDRDRVQIESSPLWRPGSLGRLLQGLQDPASDNSQPHALRLSLSSLEPGLHAGHTSGPNL